MTASRGGTPAGAAVAKLTPAGNAVWCDAGPDFIFNRLKVSGPDESLYDFIGAASGPGFVDWRPEWHGVYYDLDGNLLTLTYPSGRTITYTYNAVAQPTSAVDVANSITYASNGLYAPQGGLAQVLLGSNLTLTHIYNDRLQPCWMYATTGSALPTADLCNTADPGPGNILDLQYSFNLGTDNGNVVSIGNNRDTTRTQTFSYDQVNRMVSGQTSATTGSNCWGESFTYDQWANLNAIGALSSYTACTQDSLSVSSTTGNQISASGITYDASGNMLTDNVNSYGWNAESELKSVAGVNYTYDGDGNRLEKSSGKLYWYGAGTEILDESDLSGNFANEYVFFGGQRIAMRNVSSGTIYYYAEDVLGSSRTIVQAGQTALCYDADFTPFGTERVVNESCSSNYKFEGKERDTETGNDDFGARYYSYRFGRWLSADWSSVPAPVPCANLSNPQTLNLYAMVSDSPETFADLDGHFWNPFGWYAALLSQSSQTQSPSITSEHSPSPNQTAQPGVEVGTGTFNGQGAVTVKVVVGASAQYNKDGNLVSTTLTTATSFFGTGKNEGQFLGATETSKTWTLDPNAKDVPAVTTPLDFGQATRIMGADRIALGPALAAGDVVSHFPGAVVSSAREHPARYLAFAAEGALIATPVPEAYEGVKAGVDVVLAAAHLAWDLIH
jgi:RHS repeat-associated protein